MTKYHPLNLLAEVGELGALLAGSPDIEAFLAGAANLVTKHLSVDVCSIYLYEEEADRLTLRATKGLNPDSVGHVSIGMNEGLVGKTLREGKAVYEPSACQSPNYKYFAETMEERFESFLSVPIQRGVEKIGVLVVQRTEAGAFDDTDMLALKATASQLAGAVENARVLLSLHETGKNKTSGQALESMLVKGKVGSRGLAVGESLVMDRMLGQLRLGEAHWKKKYKAHDFERALSSTGKQLEELENCLEKKLPEAASMIFTAHQMMLKDKRFIDKMREKIDEGENPPAAVCAVARQYMDLFQASPHAYIREKASDVEDLARRLVFNIIDANPTAEVGGKARIVIARELFPSDILKLSSEGVAGMVLTSGGATSHVVILAKSLEIPLILADKPSLLEVPDRTPLLLDAEIGNLYVAPTDEVKKQFSAKEAARQSTAEQGAVMKSETFTSDGQRVKLLANINLLSELKIANDLKAEGVGLYRSEFPFLIRSTFPTEEEQFAVYKKLVDEMGGREVVIRTLDVGADKALAYHDGGFEQNPALGLRSIRFSLAHQDIFVQQLRAAFRAATGAAKFGVMFPMIASLEDFRTAKSIALDCLAALKAAGVPHNPHPKIGMMVEAPSVLEILDELADEADFFSIGTNDLIQYLLAVDRGNEKVADRFLPEHPAVLRALKKIVTVAVAKGIDVSICGEMAQDARFIPFLLGIGVRRFSVDSHFLPALQNRINAFSVKEAEAQAAALLSAKTVEEARTCLDL